MLDGIELMALNGGPHFKFNEAGLSWQIVPTRVMEMWKSGVSARSERAMKALMQMKKLDIAALRKAYDGVA